MSWNYAAAASARSVSARTTASRGFASGGGGRGRRPAVPQAWSWAWLQRLWHGERKKQRGAAKRSGRRAAEGGGKVSLGDSADAARSSVNSKVAVPESGGGTAGEEDAPSGICQHQDLDHARVQAKLKPLLAKAKLLITRKVEWASIMFAYAQETRYIIKDPYTPQRKTPVGLIREKSNVILRQLLRTRRPFIAEFTDAKGNEIFTVRRHFRWINSSIYAEVDGKEVGVVHSRWHLWRRNYDLYLGNRQFAVVENPGFWNWSFILLDENDHIVAIIDRKVRGFGLEIFMSATQYEIWFGDVGKGRLIVAEDARGNICVFRPLDLPERAVALALALSLDHDCFSRRLGWVLRLLGA